VDLFASDSNVRHTGKLAVELPATHGKKSILTRLSEKVDTLHKNIVEYLHNDPKAAWPRRVSSRYARPAYLTDPAGWSNTRSRSRQAHSEDLGRPVAGGDGIFVSGTAPAGGEGLDCGVLGAIRQRQAGKVLPAHGVGSEKARERAIEMDSVRAGDGIGSESGG